MSVPQKCSKSSLIFSSLFLVKKKDQGTFQTLAVGIFRHANPLRNPLGKAYMNQMSNAQYARENDVKIAKTGFLIIKIRA